MPFRHPVKIVKTCHCEEGGKGALNLRRESGSTRPQGTRDDKVFYHEGSEKNEVLILSLRGGSGARDAAIHRISGDVDGFVYSVPSSKWIATGLRPRDDKVEYADRLVTHSGSPRASPSR
jgi:hypothetical protein